MTFQRRQMGTRAGLAIAATVALLAAGCDSTALVGTQNGGSSGAGGTGGLAGMGGGPPSDAAGGDATTTDALPTGGGCAATIAFANGTTGGLALGPQNHAFLSPMIDAAPTENYEMQTVFSGATLSLAADFAVAPSSVTPSLASGTALDPWLGELALLTTGCAPGSLVGKKVTVNMIWLLDGAIGNVPGHGLYLGTYANGAPVAYADAQATTTRTLNTLAPVALTHEFTSATDGAEGVFLRAYLLGGDGETATTIHVESITWQ
jgi:hypothetical protein